MHILRTELKPAEGGQVVLVLRGEIDLSVAEDITEAVHLALSWGDCDAVCVDLAQVSFIDSSGLNALVAARNSAAAASKPFRIAAASPRVLHVLEVSGLDKVFRLAVEKPSDPGPHSQAAP